MLSTLLLIAMLLNAVAFQAPAFRPRQLSTLQALPTEYLEKARRCVEGKEDLTLEELEEIRDSKLLDECRQYAANPPHRCIRHPPRASPRLRRLWQRQCGISHAGSRIGFANGELGADHA